MKQTGKTFLCGFAVTTVSFPIFANEATIGVAQVINTSRQTGTLSGLLVMFIAFAAVVLFLLALRSRRLAAAREKLKNQKMKTTHVFDPRNGLPTRPM